MVTFWLLIDTIAMVGSLGSRGAAPSVVCSGGARRGAASAGGAAVSADRAAVAASVTIAGGAHRRTTSVDWAVVHRFVMPCPGCQGGIRVETNTANGWMVPVLRPVVNQHSTCAYFLRTILGMDKALTGFLPVRRRRRDAHIEATMERKSN